MCYVLISRFAARLTLLLKLVEDFSAHHGIWDICPRSTSRSKCQTVAELSASYPTQTTIVTKKKLSISIKHAIGQTWRECHHSNPGRSADQKSAGPHTPRRFGGCFVFVTARVRAVHVSNAWSQRQRSFYTQENAEKRGYGAEAFRDSLRFRC